MPTPRSITINDLTRVWAMEDGAGPAVVPEYMGVWKAGAPAWNAGSPTPVYIPSDSEYGKFDEVASMPGAEEKPTMGFSARYPRSVESDMLRMRRRGCYHDFQVHIGKCQDPQDFTLGWDKIVVLEHGEISTYGADDLGALAGDDRSPVNENIDVSGTNLYEILKLNLAEICSTSVIQEVVDVMFCDTKSCGGECGLASDGCQKLFALIRAVGGSPGLGPQLVYSDDQGSTCAATPITTLAANEDPDAMACHGDYVIVVSAASISHHYALRDQILLGTEVWAEVVAGYNAGGGPTCIDTYKPGYTWIGGLGGYVYFLSGPAVAPVVQDAGAATIQNLNAIHAYDEENVLAVGDSNAVIYTADGGTWALVIGPAPAVNLTACWMVDENTWFVGTAGGQLFYTRNAGATWIEKQFPGSGAGVVGDIVFVTIQVGYISHYNLIAGVSNILRTIDGGYEFYVLPEGTGTIPANDQINALAVCDDPNMVVGGGLGDDGADGFLVKAS